MSLSRKLKLERNRPAKAVFFRLYFEPAFATPVPRKHDRAPIRGYDDHLDDPNIGWLQAEVVGKIRVLRKEVRFSRFSAGIALLDSISAGYSQVVAAYQRPGLVTRRN